MELHELVDSLVAQGVIFRSGNKYAFVGDLFDSWLLAHRLRPARFAGEIGDLKMPSRRGQGKESVSPTSLKNLSKGVPVGQRLIEVILNAMRHFDPEFVRLHELNAQRSRGTLPLGTINMLKGAWEEFHYTSHGGVSRITKALLWVRSETDVSYTIYEPTFSSGEPVEYHGSIELESECVVFSLSCAHPNLTEKLTLRYQFSYHDPKTDRLQGLFSGINFRKLPMASTSVLVLKDKLGVPRSGRLRPQTFSLRSDDEAIELLQSAPDYFEYGPRRLTVHRSWPQKLVVDEIRNLRRGETVDIITTYFSNYYEFVELIDELSKERTLRKFRCIFADRYSSVFKLRFAFMGERESEQEEQVKKLQEYVARGGGKRGVSIKIKYSPFWPMGLALRIGRSVLFYGNIFATAGARTGAIIECRDFNSKAAKHFDDDFNKIWNLATDDPSGDALIRARGIELPTENPPAFPDVPHSC